MVNGTAFILPDAEGNQDQQHKSGDDGKEIGEEHDDVIHHAADITCQQSQDQTDRGCDYTRHKTNQQEVRVAETSSVSTSRPKLSVPSSSSRTFGTWLTFT